MSKSRQSAEASANPSVSEAAVHSVPAADSSVSQTKYKQKRHEHERISSRAHMHDELQFSKRSGRASVAFNAQTVALSDADANDHVLVAVVKALLLSGNAPASPKELAAAITHHGLTTLTQSAPFSLVASRIAQHFKRAASAEQAYGIPLLAKVTTLDPSHPPAGAQSEAQHNHPLFNTHSSSSKKRRTRYYICQPGFPSPSSPQLSPPALNALTGNFMAAPTIDHCESLTESPIASKETRLSESKKQTARQRPLQPKSPLPPAAPSNPPSSPITPNRLKHSPLPSKQVSPGLNQSPSHASSTSQQSSSTVLTKDLPQKVLKKSDHGSGGEEEIDIIGSDDDVVTHILQHVERQEDALVKIETKEDVVDHHHVSDESFVSSHDGLVSAASPPQSYQSEQPSEHEEQQVSDQSDQEQDCDQKMMLPEIILPDETPPDIVKILRPTTEPSQPTTSTTTTSSLLSVASILSSSVVLLSPRLVPCDFDIMTSTGSHTGTSGSSTAKSSTSLSTAITGFVEQAFSPMITGCNVTTCVDDMNDMDSCSVCDKSGADDTSDKNQQDKKEGHERHCHHRWALDHDLKHPESVSIHDLDKLLVDDHHASSTAHVIMDSGVSVKRGRGENGVDSPTKRARSLVDPDELAGSGHTVSPPRSPEQKPSSLSKQATDVKLVCDDKMDAKETQDEVYHDCREFPSPLVTPKIVISGSLSQNSNENIKVKQESAADTSNSSVGDRVARGLFVEDDERTGDSGDVHTQPYIVFDTSSSDDDGVSQDDDDESVSAQGSVPAIDPKMLVLYPMVVPGDQSDTCASSSNGIWATVIENTVFFVTWVGGTPSSALSGNSSTGSRVIVPRGSTLLLRHAQTGYVNATRLLHIFGLRTEQQKSVVLSLERNKVRYRNPRSMVYGTWIPYTRCQELLTSWCVGGRRDVVDRIRVFLGSSVKNWSFKYGCPVVVGDDGCGVVRMDLVSGASDEKNASPKMSPVVPSLMTTSVEMDTDDSAAKQDEKEPEDPHDDDQDAWEDIYDAMDHDGDGDVELDDDEDVISVSSFSASFDGGSECSDSDRSLPSDACASYFGDDQHHMDSDHDDVATPTAKKTTSSSDTQTPTLPKDFRIPIFTPSNARQIAYVSSDDDEQKERTKREHEAAIEKMFPSAMMVLDMATAVDVADSMAIYGDFEWDTESDAAGSNRDDNMKTPARSGGEVAKGCTSAPPVLRQVSASASAPSSSSSSTVSSMSSVEDVSSESDDVLNQKQTPTTKPKSSTRPSSKPKSKTTSKPNKVSKKTSASTTAVTMTVSRYTRERHRRQRSSESGSGSHRMDELVTPLRRKSVHVDNDSEHDSHDDVKNANNSGVSRTPGTRRNKSSALSLSVASDASKRRDVDAVTKTSVATAIGATKSQINDDEDELEIDIVGGDGLDDFR